MMIAMKKLTAFLKKDPMLVVAVLMAVISLFFKKPTAELVRNIDWKTLATLLSLLLVLDGFKSQQLFSPLIRLAGKMKSQLLLTVFLVFSVFFSSMFVTNDVSLIIFVPLTITLFRLYDKEKYLIPVLVFENIATIRGSLLTPFGSPQKLYIYGKSGMKPTDFFLMMLPLFLMSIVLLFCFILFLYRKNPREKITENNASKPAADTVPERKKQAVYLILFALIVFMIVSRTAFWPYIVLFTVAILLLFDRKVFLRVDYALLFTFLCFFVFSSQLTANETIAGFLSENIRGHEYLFSIGISQIISNVPAAIVLWPFTDNVRALLYGLDSAGLVSIIGSLASVINLRIFIRDYPGQSGKFIAKFEIISLAFFVIVFFLQFLFL